MASKETKDFAVAVDVGGGDGRRGVLLEESGVWLVAKGIECYRVVTVHMLTLDGENGGPAAQCTLRGSTLSTTRRDTRNAKPEHSSPFPNILGDSRCVVL